MVLTESEIRKYLSADIHTIQILNTTASTNEDAKVLAGDGAPHGSVVFAIKQSAARGRKDRPFSAPEGGLYFSMILRLSQKDAVYITTAASVAVCRAVEKCSDVKPEIKWVNDIFVSGKKVCGILAERIPDGTVILGIGINYAKAPDIEGAGALFERDVPNRNMFAGLLLSELVNIFAILKPADFLEEYRKHSCVIGKEIRYLENGVWHEAKAVDIDETGGLVVVADGEKMQTLCSGEITLRTK